MKRRLLSLTLALVLVLCMFPVTTFAAQNQDSSDAGIAVIKFFEGFAKYPYWDHTQYTVGYGTRCPDDKVSYYMTYGITEAQALALLKKELNSAERSLNTFIKNHGLTLSQPQFDALVSFTYNVGAGWMQDPDGLVTRAVINGATGNEFIFAMTMWCTASGRVLSGLVTRRLIESNMYLNGSYATAVPERYCYVTYDHNQCVYNGESRTVRVQGYDASMPTELYPAGVRSGYRFLGWYTATSGGKRITHLDASTNGLALHARWQSGEGKVSGGVIKGTAASYERLTEGSVKVYAAPKTSAAVVYTLASGTRISVVADYVDASGVMWCKLTDDNWLKLNDTVPELTAVENPGASGVLVTITANSMNVRSGPGTNYSIVRRAYKGEQMRITEVRRVGSTDWGKFTGGWICLDYTDYTDVGSDDGRVVATGTINLTSGHLNVRAGAGYGYNVVDTLPAGSKVALYEIVTVDGNKWGRIDKGWISMYYVDLDDQIQQPPVDEPTEPPTEPPTDEPTEPPVQEPTEKPIATGIVNTVSGTLNVRSGPGTHYTLVGKLPKATKVNIYETKTVSGTVWGRIDEGWVSLSYIKLDPTESEKEDAQTGIVNTVSGPVNIRSGPGTGYALVTTLAKGTKVTIYETKTVGSTVWGRIDEGWVSMKYISLVEDSDDEDSGSQEQTPPAPTSGTRLGTVVNCNEVNVRSGAGTGYKKLGTIKVGTRLTFTELKIVGSTVWGHCEQGWVSLDYVKLDAFAAGSLVIVDAYGVNIRSGAGTSNTKVGTYNKGDTGVLLATKKVGSVTWGQTAKGWFSLDYAV